MCPAQKLILSNQQREYCDSSQLRWRILVPILDCTARRMGQVFKESTNGLYYYESMPQRTEAVITNNEHPTKYLFILIVTLLVKI